MTTPILANADAVRIPLADESVDCVVTSSPYWSLRAYSGQQERVWGGDPDCRHEWGEKLGAFHPGQVQDSLRGNRHADLVKGQTAGAGRYCSKCSAWRGALGLEPDPDQFISNLVEVFREIRRVLKPSGCAWVNIGDSYAGSWGNYAPGGIKGKQRPQTEQGKRWERKAYGDTAFLPPSANASGLKAKDLCLIPARLSIALQADGWWIRSQIIWEKKNCMPESCKDRPTTSHEYILLLTKSARYYYDQDAVRVPLKQSSISRITQKSFDQQKGGPKDYGSKGINVNRSARRTLENLKEKYSAQVVWSNRHEGWAKRDKSIGRNRRTVWTIPAQPFAGAHFATFPVALPDICIRAGSSEHGCCAECGRPWERIINHKATPHTSGTKSSHDPRDSRPMRKSLPANLRTDPGKSGFGTPISITTGWRPTCTCGATNAVVPAVILDPFVGSGSTLIAARRLGRQGIGLDLSFPYIRDQARPRLELDRLADWGTGREAEGELDGLPLFEMKGEG